VITGDLRKGARVGDFAGRHGESSLPGRAAAIAARWMDGRHGRPIDEDDVETGSRFSIDPNQV